MVTVVPSPTALLIAQRAAMQFGQRLGDGKAQARAFELARQASRPAGGTVPAPRRWFPRAMPMPVSATSEMHAAIRLQARGKRDPPCARA